MATANKEPWQMTKSEYTKKIYSQFKNTYPTAEPPINFIKAQEITHKEKTEQALSEGKLVPPEVLADYPELQSQRIKIGDTISDGLVSGKVVGEGAIKMGRKELPAYRIELSNGKPDLIIKDQITSVKIASETPSKSDLLTAHESRSPQAQSQDNSQLNSAVLSPDDPKTKSWLKDFGDYDVRGIDTPSSGKGRAAKTKRKKGGKRKGSGGAGGTGGMKGIR